MLFYNFETLDKFIENDLIRNLKSEQQNIKEISNLYISKKINVLSITTNIIELADSIDKNKSEHFYQTVSSLKNLLEKLNLIQELIVKLGEDLTSTISLYDKSIENNKDEIKANLVEYNKQRDELSNKILEFETLNTSILNATIALSLSVSRRKFKKKIIPVNTTIKKEESKIDVELEPYDNNILIISEKEQKAYLPFFYSEVKKIYQNSNNQYKTLQDVVESLYIVPLNRFKNSTIARFKESFRLMKEKENSSVSKALDLGLEMMFRYELNPIIIAACRSLDELDIYLDCLEENELQNFTCFKIKFDVMPSKT